jgi:hypothetical protein
VTVALAFFVAATAATLRVAHLAHRSGALLGGLVCLALVALSSLVYYGGVLPEHLPVAQKLTFALGAAWLLAVHYTEFDLDGRTPDSPSDPSPVRSAV